MKILATSALMMGAAALFAACGGSQQTSMQEVVPQNRSVATRVMHGDSWMLPHYEVSGPLAFVANVDPLYDPVTIYDAKVNDPSPIAVISAGVSEPVGDCVDADGTLYVANEPGSSNGWISEYALGTIQPLREITQGISAPAFCAIDAKGNLWVTNFGNATVTEYLKGATVPHFTLTNGLTAPNGIAIDHDGNIYVANLQPYGTSNVQVYAKGSESPSRTITDGIKWPADIAVDAAGTLYVSNNALGCNIEEYRSGESYPYQTITKKIDGATGLAFGKNDWLYEVNEGASYCGNRGPWPAVLEFRPHRRSPSKRMITNDLHTPAGVAYYPPLLQ